MLDIKNISFAYSDNRVLKDLNLSLKKGDIFALLGSSGCGKSTLLKLIAGLIEPQNGSSLQLEGQSLIYLKDKVEKRGIGYVFQDGALFPHFSVEKNILYGLSKLSKSERTEQMMEAAKALQIDSILKRYPHEISGGQQQRVAIARALVKKPKLLLLDEPFSSLDAKIKEHLVVDIRHVLKEADVTTLLVTHDQKEAFAMADRIGVMHEGQILQEGAPNHIYEEPQSEFIAHFVGKGKTVKGAFFDNSGDKDGSFFIRPEWISPSNSEEGFQAKVTHQTHFFGSHYELELSLEDGQKLLCNSQKAMDETQFLKWKLNHPAVKL